MTARFRSMRDMEIEVQKAFPGATVEWCPDGRLMIRTELFLSSNGTVVEGRPRTHFSGPPEPESERTRSSPREGTGPGQVPWDPYGSGRTAEEILKKPGPYDQ